MVSGFLCPLAAVSESVSLHGIFYNDDDDDDDDDKVPSSILGKKQVATFVVVLTICDELKSKFFIS